MRRAELRRVEHNDEVVAQRLTKVCNIKMTDNSVVDSKSSRRLLALGDLHGAFGSLMDVIEEHDLRDLDIIQVGDLGIGFLEPSFETKVLEAVAELLEERDINLYAIRGNHDDPARFTGEVVCNRLHLLQDYTVMRLSGQTVFLVGGAISIDRVPRVAEGWGYFPDEDFVLDIPKIQQMLEDYGPPDIVITHDAPPPGVASFLAGRSTHFVDSFAKNDPTLWVDILASRGKHQALYDLIRPHGIPNKWVFGHYHKNNSVIHDGTNFIMVATATCVEL